MIMATLGTFYIVIIVIMACFAIGSFFALPMIWYHVGHISRKLTKLGQMIMDEIERNKK